MRLPQAPSQLSSSTALAAACSSVASALVSGVVWVVGIAVSLCATRTGWGTR